MKLTQYMAGLKAKLKRATEGRYIIKRQPRTFTANLAA
jgi:hypothetical protein